MFEASQSKRSWGRWLGLGGLVVVLSAAGLWMQQAPAPAPAPRSVQAKPVFAGTAADASALLESVSATHADVEIWHLECDTLPCLAVVRLDPSTHGVRRIALERELKAKGWSLSPAGIVKVLEPHPPTLPARVIYTLALSEEPLQPEARAPIKDRMRVLSAEADTAPGAW